MQNKLQGTYHMVREEALDKMVSEIDMAHENCKHGKS